MEREALIKYMSNKKQKFSSKDFGVKTNLHWIYKDWKLPMEENEAALHIMCLHDDMDIDGLKSFYNDLKRLNPVLGRLKTDNMRIMYHICFGAISKYNYNDIKFFSLNDDTLESEVIRIYNMRVREQKSKIVMMLNTDIQWVMSPPTLKRVNKELGIK